MPDPNDMQGGALGTNPAETQTHIQHDPPVADNQDTPDGSQSLDPALSAWQKLPPEIQQNIYSNIQRETVMQLHNRGALKPPEAAGDKGGGKTSPPPKPETPIPDETPDTIIRRQIAREVSQSMRDVNDGKKSMEEAILDAAVATAKITTGLSTSLTQRQIEEATAGLERVAYDQKKAQFYQQQQDIAEYSDVIDALIEREGGPSAMDIANAIREVNKRQNEKRMKQEEALARREPDAFGGLHMETPRGRVSPADKDVDLDALADQIIDAQKAGDEAKLTKLMRKWDSAVPR